MEDRLSTLEKRVDELLASMKGIEARLSVLDGREAAPAAALGKAGLEPAAADEASAVAGFLASSGRLLLVLGGAFLVRALTDAGTVPPGVGVLLGFAYAGVWIVAAERAGRRHEGLSGTFHGAAALLVSYPLVWEAATRFHVLSPVGAAAALGVLTAVLVGVAWRGDLFLLATGTTLGTIVLSGALVLATHAVDVFALLLLALGLALLWLTYGRRWHGLRWPAAIAVDLAVLLLSDLVAREGGPPEGYENLSRGTAIFVGVALFATYLGSFALRTLWRRRDVTFFEVFQTLAALLVGFGGAIRIVRAHSGAGLGATALDIAAWGVAAGCYAVALAFAEDRLSSRNFLFFSSLGLVLALFSSDVIAGTPKTVLFSALGVAAAFAGRPADRVTLRVHAVIYLVVAAWESRLLGSAFEAFVGEGPRWVAPAALIALFAAAAAYALLVTVATAGMPAEGSPLPWPRRVPTFALAVLTLLGVGTVAVELAARLAPRGPEGIALVRSAVLVGAATALAALSTKPRLAEATWLVYPLLVAGALKLVLEDFRVGRPATLFPAFALYGLALIVVPKLLKRRPAPVS